MNRGSSLAVQVACSCTFARCLEIVGSNCIGFCLCFEGYSGFCGLQSTDLSAMMQCCYKAENSCMRSSPLSSIGLRSV